MLNKVVGISCVLAISAGIPTAVAADCSETLVFNQADKTVRPEGSAKPLQGELPTYRATGSICLKVENTSTGAFDVSFDSAGKEELGNVAALKTFWTDFKPLQLDLLRSALGPDKQGPRFAPPAEPAAKAAGDDEFKELLKQVRLVDETVGIARDLEFRAVRAMSQMAAKPSDTQVISGQFADCDTGAFPGDVAALTSCKDTLKQLDELPILLNNLVKAIHAASNDEGINKEKDVITLLEAARERRQQFSTLLFSARQVGELVKRIREAKTVVSGPEVRPTWDEGRLIVVTITPVSVGELGSAGGRGTTFKVKVVPARGPRLSAGVSLLYAPGATYSKYGEVTQENGQRVVAATETLDRRLLWVVTLSATWSSLDDRDRSGWALYLPELVVGPKDDGLAVGIGAAVGWKMVRLNTGLLWAKRPVLEGQTEGTVLEAGQTLKVRDGYDFSAPAWYLGLGIAL